jgi:hypothetical protein
VWTGEGEPSVDDETSIEVGNAGSAGEGGAAGENDGVESEAAALVEIG